MTVLIKNLRHDESGQDLIEYALIAALIALGAVVAMQSVAANITTLFGKIATQIGT